MKGLIFALFLIPVAIAAFALGSTASAQTDPVTCDSFATQAEAQVVLDADPGDEHGLDPDGNGIACEDFDYAAAEAAAAAEAEAAAAGDPAAVPSTGGPPASSSNDLTGLALLGAMLLVVGGLAASVALRPKSR